MMHGQTKIKWNECTKATLTKQLLPHVKERLKMKINVSPNFAAVVTGYGKTRVCFHRFKIMEQATGPFNNGDQTIDHLLYQ